MRIQHGHDYYDKALAHGGHDDPIFFERFKDTAHDERAMRAVGIAPIYRDLLIKDTPPERNGLRIGDRNLAETASERFRVGYVNVFVAGKRYHALRVEDATYHVPYRPSKTTFYWSLAPFLEFLEEKRLYLHERDQVSRSRYGVHRNSDPAERPLADYFGADTQVSDAVRDVLIANNISIYLAEIPWDYDPQAAEIFPHRAVRWQVNPPTLKDVEFFKVMDAYTVYQELEMWIGGVLPNAGRPMVTISDKDKVGKHGFNDWSFRRHRDDPR